MRNVTLLLIHFYQKLSFLKIPWARFVFLSDRSCRFSPTCSQYISAAIKKYGIIKGAYLGVKRILRCNPLFKGGFNPLP